MPSLMILASSSSSSSFMATTISIQNLIIISIMMGMINAQQQQQQSASSIPMMMQTFDATWDALKCAMKISLIQMAKYHNNQMSCCGLWIVKWFIKSSAEEYCERPDGAKQIFDQYINGDLIYNQMVRSVLGDPDLSCDPYPEGSSACTRLWIILILLIVIGIVSMYLIIMWCCCVTCFWCRTRKENRRLRARILGIDGPEESSTMTSVSTTNLIDSSSNNNIKQQQQQRDDKNKQKSSTTNVSMNIQSAPLNQNPLHEQMHSMNNNHNQQQQQQQKTANGFLALNAYTRPLQIGNNDNSSDKIPIPIDDDDDLIVTGDSNNNNNENLHTFNDGNNNGDDIGNRTNQSDDLKM
ncbi:uncharacterized protein LOC124490293 [Dermatophagoides farinae]|uniref:uncharacterized protein LOC124490293 n=1 Tax=Dermatophagoides farinae TaxID=6954 RepID=UPI003F600CA4